MTNLSTERLLALAERYGTPLYVYDAETIRKQYHSLVDAFSWASSRLFYAMKANYSPAVLNVMRLLGAGIDSVSIAEIKLALECGFSPADIMFTANNVETEELKAANDLGILCNIDSLSVLERFGAACTGTRVCLRVNPNVVAGAHSLIQTGGSTTKFGIALSDIDEAMRIAEFHSLKVVGVHKHTGSGIVDADVFLQAIRNILSEIHPERFPDLRFVDFGGGFAVPYAPGDVRIDYHELGSGLKPVFEQFCKGFSQPLELYFEPGKFLVAESGYLLCRVNTLKENSGRLIAGTNSGFTHLIRPVLYNAYHPIENVSNPDAEEELYDIVGNICETGDRFAERRAIANIKEGDVLAISMAGAYCYSMASEYNLRPLPSEVLVDGDRDRLIRKALNPDQLVKRILSESVAR